MEKQLKHEDPLDALILDFLDAKKGDGKMKKKKKMTENKRLDIPNFKIFLNNLNSINKSETRNTWFFLGK